MRSRVRKHPRMRGVCVSQGWVQRARGIEGPEVLPETEPRGEVNEPLRLFCCSPSYATPTTIPTTAAAITTTKPGILPNKVGR